MSIGISENESLEDSALVSFGPGSRFLCSKLNATLNRGCSGESALTDEIPATDNYARQFGVEKNLESTLLQYL